MVRCQSYLENSKESILPVCDKPPSQDQRKSTALGGACKFAEQCILTKVVAKLNNNNSWYVDYCHCHGFIIKMFNIIHFVNMYYICMQRKCF